MIHPIPQGRILVSIFLMMSGILICPVGGRAQEEPDRNSSPPPPASQPLNEEIPIRADKLDDTLIAKRLLEIYRNVPGLTDVRLEVSAGVARLSGHTQSKEAYEQALELAKRMEGVISVKDEITQQRDIGQRLAVVQEKIRAQVNTFVSYIPLLMIALVVFLFFGFLATFMTKWPSFYEKLTPNPFLQALVKQTVKGLILFFGFVMMLEILDATALLGTILGVAGILGIAIGFAIRDTVENYLASILLSIRQPFQPRDHIVIEKNEGLVMKLTTRDTILMTMDGNHVRIPNATVYKSIILNYTRNPNRRFTFEVGIDTVVDIAAAQKLAIQTLSQSPGVIADPAATCTVEKLGDSNVVLRMFGWTTQTQFDFGKVKSEAIRAVKEAFDHANYEMPEPIYRLKFQGAPTGDDRIAKKNENAAKDQHPSSRIPSPSRTDVSKNNHIVKQISMEKENSREMNLLVAGKSTRAEQQAHQSGQENQGLLNSEKTR